jgi:chemotaxis regulatin CheY-phosphate phosphatase CheZ
MLSRFRQAVSLTLVIAITSLGMIVQAQAQGAGQQVSNRTRREEILTILARIDNRMTQFRKALDERMDRSYLDDTRAEDNINRRVRNFFDSRDRLHASVKEREHSADEARDLLRRAALIDSFMENRSVWAKVHKEWMDVRVALDRLADLYHITPEWNNTRSTVVVSDINVRQLISRIETRTDSFKANLEDALDRSRIDGSRREDNINALVQDFETATDRLRDRYTGSLQVSRVDAQEVLARAVLIDRFMIRFNVGKRAAPEWQALRQDLDQLALAFNISPSWGAGGGIGVGTGGGNWAANRLTGTFRLDRSQSEDARTAADRATRDLPSGDRQYVYDRLINRLESPDMIAIDRNGRNVTIASTRSPQITFEADGQEHIEQTANGRTLRVTATLSGDQLSVTTTGNRDTDFNVTFDPVDGGRRLRVTRRLSSDRLNREIEVQSVYDRTSDVAQWSVYSGSPGYPTTTSGDFIIPNNTQMMGILNTNLSTSQSRDGDRFTMTVREPGQYDGAIIEGYVSGLDRGGRITGRSEMTLNFDRIQLRNGRTYNFAGIVQSVRTPNGEVVNVNNEGNVREDNRTGTTAARAAIGTGIGALIGAIAGGAKGAAIGAAIGAGAGAGSVYVQGRDDLILTTGTEVTILATGPR